MPRAAGSRGVHLAPGLLRVAGVRSPRTHELLPGGACYAYL
jgi:hypothetical protein